MTFAEQAEPAFKMNQNSMRLERRRKNRKCCDAFYSFSNLALITLPIVGLVYMSQFLYDDPIYAYGESLLPVSFWRQVVFVVVVFFLTFAVPITNAIGAFVQLHNSNTRVNLGLSILVLKIIFQIIMVVLAFVGLLFLLPYVRSLGVRHQLDIELQNHMARRAVMQDHAPQSCFSLNSPSSAPFSQTCSEVLAAMVSTRCLMGSIALAIIMVALIMLVVIDSLQLWGQEYDVAAREAQRYGRHEPLDAHGRANPPDHHESQDQDHLDHVVTHIDDEHTSAQRDKDRHLRSQSPFLPASKRNIWDTPTPDPYNTTRQEVARLTKANFIDSSSAKPQKPLLLDRTRLAPSPSRLGSRSPSPNPSKSSLKKSSSGARLEAGDSDESVNLTSIASIEPKPDETFETYERTLRIQRDVEHRKSVQRVQFQD